MVLVTSAYTSFLISSDDLAVCCNKEYLWRTDGFIVCHTGSGIPCDLEINSTCLSIKLSPRTAAPANDMINEMLGGNIKCDCSTAAMSDNADFPGINFFSAA